MATNNQITTSNLVSVNASEFLMLESNVIAMGTMLTDPMVGEDSKRSVGQSIAIKQQGYGAGGRGLVPNVEDLNDRVINLTINETDVYTSSVQANVLETVLNFLGGDKALTDLQRKHVVDNYAVPNAEVISANIEKETISRFSNTIHYTITDSPEKIVRMDSIAQLIRTQSLMNSLNMPQTTRWCSLPTEDMANLKIALGNSYNNNVNKNINEDNVLSALDSAPMLAKFKLLESTVQTVHEPGEQYAINKQFQVESISADGTEITFKNVGTVSSRLFKAGDVIFIPSVKLLSRITKLPIETTLTVVVAEDANGVGAGGKCTVKLNNALLASGRFANVASLPVNNAPAQLAPRHRKSFFGGMSTLNIISVQLNNLYGASNLMSNYNYEDRDVKIQMYLQGDVRGGLINTYVMACCMPMVVNPTYGAMVLTAP